MNSEELLLLTAFSNGIINNVGIKVRAAGRERGTAHFAPIKNFLVVLEANIKAFLLIFPKPGLSEEKRPDFSHHIRNTIAPL